MPLSRRRSDAASATASITSTVRRTRGRPDAPAGRRRPAPDVHQRGHALVGRLAAVRQRPPHAGQGAQRRRRQAHRHRRRPAARSIPRRAPSSRASRRNWWVALGAIHTLVRPRAQRHLRPAGGRPPRLGRRGAVPDGSARELGRHGEDPHGRVDAGDPAEPHAARRHVHQLVRAGHQPVRRQAQEGARGDPDRQPGARRHPRQPAGDGSPTSV